MSEVKRTAPDSFVEQAMELVNEACDDYELRRFRMGQENKWELRALLTRQAARCKELEEDAARYRWLKRRDNKSTLGVRRESMDDSFWLYDSLADAAIDAARSALSAPKEQST